MQTPPPEFNDVITHVAERMARVLLPQHLQEHTDTDIDAINAQWGGESAARLDTVDDDDIATINQIWGGQR
ncbi:hypothetical protein ACQ4N7_28450 [Nodosilinea sp. AN01ver1]|uniref:hypothetical protein n=1 Tax=Nodosilinea sp. AN01ver1 TaxID=3423362 RepID=UPI003D3156F9